LSGINKIKNLHIVSSIKKTDIVFLRNKPESTTGTQLRKIDSLLENVRSDKLVINDVKNFFHIDNKDLTFDIWGKNNVKYPYFCLLYPNNIQKSIEKIVQMLSIKESILLRINNRTGGTSMIKIDQTTPQDIMITKLDSLISKTLHYQKKRPQTKIMAVEHINNGSKKYNYSFRVHVLVNEIVSYYVGISKKLVVSMSDLECDDLDEFVHANIILIQLMEDVKFRQKIIRAVTSITNMGAIDFLLIDNEPIFLEINPIWKGNFFEKNFGNNAILLDWFYKKPELEKIIPNIFEFKSPIQYWEKFYLSLQNKC
jgi:hypothetical protein